MKPGGPDSAQRVARPRQAAPRHPGSLCRARTGGNGRGHRERRGPCARAPPQRAARSAPPGAWAGRSRRSRTCSTARRRPSAATCTTRPARRPSAARPPTPGRASAAAPRPRAPTARTARRSTASAASRNRGRAGRASSSAVRTASGASASASSRPRSTGRARTHAAAVARRSSATALRAGPPNRWSGGCTGRPPQPAQMHSPARATPTEVPSAIELEPTTALRATATHDPDRPPDVGAALSSGPRLAGVTAALATASVCC